MSTRGDVFVKFLLLLSSIIHVTVCKRRLSTACAAPNQLSCTQHKLRCFNGRVISVYRGQYGYINCWYQCSRSKTCKAEECCKGYPDHTFYGFNEDDWHQLVSDCTGKGSCVFTSPYHETNCSFRHSRYVYSIVDYYCAPILLLNDTSTTNVIRSRTVFVKKSTDKADWSCVVSTDRPVYFYQTSESCHDVFADRGIAKCNTTYEVTSNYIDPLQFYLNNTDVVVQLKSDGQMKVNCSCYSPIDVFDATDEMVKVNLTVDNSTLIEGNFNASRRVMSSNESGNGGGEIAGMVIGSLVVVILVVVIIIIIIVLRRRRIMTRNKTEMDDGVTNYSYGLSSSQLVSGNYLAIDNKGSNSQNTYDHIGIKESDDGYNHIGDITSTSVDGVAASVDDYNHINRGH